jgi:two-component system cell cycle response regulator DivK
VNATGTGRLALIVEDNERNLRLARDVLEFHGFRTLAATSGEEGMDLARSHRPDVVLTDIALPGMDGVAVVRALKADPATAGIPVVALTASVMQSDRDRFDGAGFAGLIAKPIDVLTFGQTVAGYCAADPTT